MMINFFKHIFKKKDIGQKKANIKYKYEKLYEKIGYYPKNEELIYIKALTHSSYNKKIYEKNERLEFLGDAVLSFIVAEILYEKFEEKNEGMLTRLRSNVVNRKYLNEIGFKLELHQYLKHKLHTDFYITSPDIIGNTFEALIGAYYVDWGIDITKKIVHQLLIQNIDFDSISAQAKDRKSYLFEWCQMEKKSIFIKHISKQDSTHTFDVEIYIDGSLISSGGGKNKKEAELEACTQACTALGI